MIERVIGKKYLQRYKKGYPVLTKDLVETWPKMKREGCLIKLVSQNKEFMGIAYYGKENKKFGWVLSRDKGISINGLFFRKKIETAYVKRKKMKLDKVTTAYRVFNGIGDGIGGITIDYLAGYCLITWYNKGIYTFRENILKALEQVVPSKGIYEKFRYQEVGKIDLAGYVSGEKAPSPLIIDEMNVKFAVYLEEGQMIGIFLDQRNVRQTLREKYSKGKYLLNLFSYTGAFSVSAALGGAVETISVDLANRSKKKTEEQFKLNGLDMANHKVVVEEVFSYFRYAKRKGLQFDVVVLDPPSFSRFKKKTFSVAKNYGNLLSEAIEVTKKGGLIIASTNYAQINQKKFEEVCGMAFKEKGHTYSILERYCLPEDFAVATKWPEGNYLKVLFLKKID